MLGIAPEMDYLDAATLPSGLCRPPVVEVIMEAILKAFITLRHGALRDDSQFGDGVWIDLLELFDKLGAM